MAEYREFSAKTVSDCITDACMTFSVTSDRLDYVVVSEGSSGFMGLGVKPAVIKARIKEESFEQLEAAQAEITAAEEAARKEKEEKEAAEKAAKREAERKENAERAAAIREREGIPTVTEEDERAYREKKRQERRERNDRGRGRRDDRRRFDQDNEEVKPVVEEPAKPLREIPEEEKAQLISQAESFLKDVFASMHIEVNISSSFGADNTLNVDLSGEEMGILIGKRGQTLDSLQYLTSLVINKGTEEYVRIKIDTENYRFRRKETLEKLARNIAFKVKRSRRPVALEPMNPYERRIIHSALQSDRYVTTHSEGEEPYRKVVVTLKNYR